MGLCDHEEADTRLLIHLQNAFERGSTTCLVHTVDTDVLFLVIGQFYELVTLYPAADIWVAFGRDRNFTHLLVSAICHALGKKQIHSHGFTGCDTTCSVGRTNGI